MFELQVGATHIQLLQLGEELRGEYLLYYFGRENVFMVKLFSDIVAVVISEDEAFEIGQRLWEEFEVVSLWQLHGVYSDRCYGVEFVPEVGFEFIVEGKVVEFITLGA